MGDDRFSFPANVIAGKRRLDVDDLMILRKHAFSDGIRTQGDLRLLLAIQRSCASSCPEWNSYLVESVASYAVHMLHPRGWIDDANADWLIDTLSIRGIVHCPLELEALLHTLEIAASAPDRLYAFALEQMRLGMAPAARNAYAVSRPSHAVGVDMADLHYLWRVLRSASNSGRLVLSAIEREILQAIDALADPADHHAGWNTLADALLPAPRAASGPRKSYWLRLADENMPDGQARAA